MSREARFMCGLALVLVPTIVYGGLALLGVLSGGAYGMPAPQGLSPLQASLYRAGHAHAGVLTLLGLALQMMIDDVAVPASLTWPARIAALTAPLFVAGGFFGLAHVPGLRILLYVGGVLVIATTLTVGVGLLRAR
ncbi:MAG TPA: hypothetical protein VFT47_16555 [Vicinamibacterales bacterium]|nr:hypothetical protein [Vicinamibacterales bacterium]